MPLCSPLHSVTLFTAVCFTLSDTGSCFLLRSYCPRINLLEVTEFFFFLCIIQQWAEFHIRCFKVKEATEREKINKTLKQHKAMEQNIIIDLKKHWGLICNGTFLWGLIHNGIFLDLTFNYYNLIVSLYP